MKKILKNSGKIAVALSVIGVGALVAVVRSGAHYPDLLFRILIPIGILCVAMAVVLYIMQWISTIYKHYKKGEKTQAAIIFIMGLAVILYSAFRIYRK